MKNFELYNIIFDDEWIDKYEDLYFSINFDEGGFDNYGILNSNLKESLDISNKSEEDLQDYIQELEKSYNDDLEKFRASDDEDYKEEIKQHALGTRDEIENVKSQIINMKDEKLIKDFNEDYAKKVIKGKSSEEALVKISQVVGDMQIAYKNLYPDTTKEDFDEIAQMVEETFYKVLNIKLKPTDQYFKDDMGEVFKFTNVRALSSCKSNDSIFYKPSRESPADVIIQARHYEGDDDTVFYRDEGSYKRISKTEAAKNIPEWDTLGGVSKAEEKVIQTYSHFTPHNKFLRNGGDISKFSDAKKLKDIIDRTNSGPGIYYRGVTEDYANELRAMRVGEVISDKGFMSASTEMEIAEEFLGKNGIIMIISSKGGVGKCISVGSYSEYSEENEYIFNTNTKMKIIEKSDNYIKVEVL